MVNRKSSRAFQCVRYP